MATQEQVKAFINKIAPLARSEYSKGKKILPSICIAQACCESAYGTSSKMIAANAVFGIKVGSSKVHFGTAWKDKAYNTQTKECYDGKTYTNIVDMFRAYDSIADSVTDYYDMMCKASRYKAAIGETDYVKAITAIKNGGYATSPTYISTITSIIKTYGLTKYDTTGTIVEAGTIKKSVDEIAKEVIAGKWGTGIDRKNKLETAGYNYSEVQNRVNTLSKVSTVVASKTHKVLIGDTLSKIASKYGTTIDKIIANNKVKYPKIKANFIVIGWVLKV